MTLLSQPFDAAQAVETRKVLHVGCGAAHPDKLPPAFFPAGMWS